jgi:gamma-glutamyltranspeptidase/glutathione hydrolase
VLGILATRELPDVRINPVQAIHLFAEANRLAFADRNLYLGDPKFVAAPVAGLLDSGYLRARASLIDPEKAMATVAPGDPLPAAAWDYAPGAAAERPSTSHFSIVDRHGDAVAMTTSVQGAFGSQLMVGGFILNNQLTDFDYVPVVGGKPVANRVEGGKRPLSSMSPTMLLDERGRLRLLVGSPGGTRIIGFVAQSIVGVVDWKLDVQQAVAAPHFLAEEGPIEIEEGTALAADVQALEALGHRVVQNDMNSGLHAIAIEYTRRGRVLFGGVDPRREGVALGD